MPPTYTKLFLGTVAVLTAFAITKEEPDRHSLFVKERKYVDEVNDELHSQYLNANYATAKEACEKACKGLSGDKNEMCHILIKAHHSEYKKYAESKGAKEHKFQQLDRDDVCAQLSKFAHATDDHHGHGKH